MTDQEEIVWPPRGFEGKAPKKWMRNRQVMIEVMDNGRSVPEVAKAFGISQVRVYEILRSPRSWEAPKAPKPKNDDHEIIKKLPDGRWLVDLKINGQPRCRTAPSKAEAEEILAGLRLELAS